jgi:hypothetical protein
MIGHTIKECSIKLDVGEEPIYSKDLKAYIPSMTRRHAEADRSRCSGGRDGVQWRNNSGGGAAGLGATQIPGRKGRMQLCAQVGETQGKSLKCLAQ